MLTAGLDLNHSKSKSTDSTVSNLDMQDLVHIAADVYVPRYKLLSLPLPSSPAFLPPILEPEDCEVTPRLPSLAEVLARPCTPMSMRRDDVDTRPVFPGKLVVPDIPVITSDELEDGSDDESFPVYGAIQVAMGARSKGKRKRDEDLEEIYQARSA